MKAAVLVVLAVLALPASAAAIETTETWRPHVHAAKAYAQKRAGSIPLCTT